MSGANFILGLLGYEPAESAGLCFFGAINQLKIPPVGTRLAIPGFQEIMRKNLTISDFLFTPMTLDQFLSVMSDKGLTHQAPDELSLIVAIPIALFSSGGPIHGMKLVSFFLQNEFGIRFYLPDYEKKCLSAGPIDCVSRHPIYHRSVMLEEPVALLPDSPGETVLYSDRLPIADLGASIKPISRETISALISSHRGGYPFRFTTGVESLIPEYRSSPLSLSPQSLAYIQRLISSKAMPQATKYIAAVDTLFGPDVLSRELVALRSRLAICFMGASVGFGVFNVGTESIPIGAFLGIYEGQMTSNTTYGDKDAVLIRTEKGSLIQSSKFAGGYIGLMNHSESGNAETMRCIFENTAGKSFELSCFFASKTISSLEQITWNYGEAYNFGTHTALVFDRYGRETSGVIRDPATGFELE